MSPIMEFRLHAVDCPNCGRSVCLDDYELGDLILCRCEYTIGRSTGDGIEPW